MIDTTNLIENDLVLFVGQLGRLDHVQEVAVHQQVVIQGRAVAHRALPGRLPLVHLQEEARVEALQMIARGGPTRHRHPHLAERARHRHLQVRRRDFVLVVVELISNELTRELRIT